MLKFELAKDVKISVLSFLLSNDFVTLHFTFLLGNGEPPLAETLTLTLKIPLTETCFGGSSTNEISIAVFSSTID